jgi:hypothetical protein
MSCTWLRTCGDSFVEQLSSRRHAGLEAFALRDAHPATPVTASVTAMSHGSPASGRVALSELYRGTRERVVQLVSGPADDVLPVPATPGWTVHDVVAHLTGVAEDMLTGGPQSGPTPEWTAGHVARGRGVSMADLLATWAQCGPKVEALLDQTPIWPVVLDAGSHELDIRSAVGDTSLRDSALVMVGAKVLLRGLDVPLPLRVVTQDHDVRVGPEAPGEEPVVLRTTTYEAFRWRLGRRSRAQLAAMDWGGADPTPFLDHLCIFGPADDDVLE